MKKIWIFVGSHLTASIIGFAAGIYALPLLTAQTGASDAEIRAVRATAHSVGNFKRGLPGSDPLHWAQGTVVIADDAIAFEGDVAPGPDYKVYLAPEFVDTKEKFLAAKSHSVRVGDLKTFGNFVMKLPRDIAIDQYTTVVIWCERFSQFISAAQYH
ncbi:hypothetical protein J2785_007232 [Burkholderia ambifaria]|nr:DM13 domain-containing protein [Burkholderia ambifaria]MDR6504038.1 hypothetical protein [Burkholderia ambifaria]